MEAIKKHRHHLIALAIFFLAFFLRVYRLPEFIAYHQDQVRDLIYIKDHFDKGEMILLGPKASVGNFFLAPFWYYLMSATYLFSHSPVAPASMVALLNAIAAPLIYFFCRRFFNEKIAVVSALLYAVSPFSIEYSRFAWNPNPIPFFTIISLYFLYLYLDNRNKIQKNFIYFAVIFANLTFQLHYQGFLLVIAVFLFPLFKKDWKRLIISSLIFMLMLSPFFFYEIKNNYPNLKEIFSFLGRTTSGHSFGIMNSFKAFVKDYPEFIARNLFFGFLPLGLIFSVVTYFICLKNIFCRCSKKDPNKKNIFIIYSVLLLTLFAYRQWIVPYYLLVLIIPLVVMIAILFEKVFFLMIPLIIINLIMSPAFAKTDSSLYFFKKVVKTIRQYNLPENCIAYQIENSDLKFTPKAVSYLLDSNDEDGIKNGDCQKKLMICEIKKCDRIAVSVIAESEKLNLKLIELKK